MWPRYLFTVGLLGVLCGLVGSVGSSGQEDLPCARCKSTGKVSIRKPTDQDDLEAEVRFCSYAMRRDVRSRGLGWIPCSPCRSVSKAAAARKEFDALVGEREEWLAARDETERELGVSLEHVETRHFLLSWGVPRIRTADKKVYDMHAAAHLYASRLEAFYRLFQETLGITDEQCRNTFHKVMVFKSRKTIVAAAERYLEVFSDTAAYQAGDPSIFLTFMDRGSFPREEDLHQHLVHHVTHLLCGVYHFKRLIDEFGFLHEGLAHWFEMNLFGNADNSCNREQVEEDLGRLHFEALVKKAVVAEKAPSFAEFSRKRTPDLAGRDHAFAWSYTDFLIESGPTKVRDLIARLKRKTPLLASLRELFGWNFGQVQDAWSAFVTENYSAREDRPKRTKRPSK